jgi:hypothetical protein
LAIIVNVNGNTSGQGFLIAPLGDKTFDVPLGLSTNDGTIIDVSLQSVGDASIAFDQNQLTINPFEKFVNIHATSPSTSRNDTFLLVFSAGTLRASFNITAITQPQIWFKGRFQARFATDSDFYNEKRGTLNGWNFALEGESDFVPEDSVPSDINKPVGREIRFNNPVALRTHVPPIGVYVISIKGKVGMNTEEFFAGDPIIGQQADLGPHTYLASNNPPNPADPPPAENTGAGLEAMALFEFHINNAFSGKSRNPGDRPRSSVFTLLTDEELNEYGIIVDQGAIPSATFDNARRDALLTDYKALSSTDKIGTVKGRNLFTRISRLGGEVSEGIPSSLDQNKTLPAGWIGKEEYVGVINDLINFQPFESSVLRYFSEFNLINFFARLFNYHSDEQCGQVHGCISIDKVPPSPPNIALIRRFVNTMQERLPK